MTKALTYVEIDVDFCSLTWGTLPCLARFGYSGGQTGPNAVEFDGQSDLAKRGGGLTGAADSKLVTGSLWFRLMQVGVAQTLIAAETTLNGATYQFIVDLDATNHLHIRGKNSAGTVILDVSTAALTLDNQLHHLLFSFDLSNTGKRWLYLDDVSALSTVTTYTNDTLDFTSSDWSIGGLASGASLAWVDFSDIWLNLGGYLDLSVSGNRRLFIASDFRPVYLGSTGQTPTGSTPILFLSNTISTWLTNLGTGGDFTLTGSLTSVKFATGSQRCFNSRGTCQSPTTFTNVPVTLRFAVPTDYLPDNIDCIPNLDGISFTPAVVSLGKDLGQRASVSAVFTDHRWPDTGTGYDPYLSTRTYDPYRQGTYWAKFRSRQPYLQGRPFRLIRGYVGQALVDMETRHYIIDSFTGPTPNGKYSITAKDVLKLADGDQAQAPVISGGSLSANILATDTVATLQPAGIGNAEYPSSGLIAIGGSEICSFGRDPTVGLDTNTLLLLHMAGTAASTTFTDTSSFARTGTANGNAQISASDTAPIFSADPKSGLFDGSGDFVSFPDSNDWTFSTDFTVDMWAKFTTSLNTLETLFSHSTDANNQYRLKVDNTGIITFEVISASSVIITMASAAATIVVGNWYHIAVVRVGTVYTIYVNGVSVATVTTATSIPNYTSTFRVGNDATGTTNGFKGFMDEFRVSKVARWSTAFTKPVGEYQSSSDVIAMVRGQNNTVAVNHSGQDRAQICIVYTAKDPADIIYDLLVNYTKMPSSYIDLTAWKNETANFLRVLYTTVLAQPSSVNALVSELIEQAALAVWWDDEAQKLQLQVLRAIDTAADTFTSDDYLDGSFQTQEQPDKRVSQVWTYYAQRNPLALLTDPANYFSAAATVSDDAETNYGIPAIKTIFSRWIPALGLSIAQRLNAVQLGRFVTPPRKISFSTMRFSNKDVSLGIGYQIQGWTLQDETGAMVKVPIQATQLTPNVDKFDVVAEEALFTSFDTADLNNRVVIISANTQDFNLRTAYDTLYPAPIAGITVSCYINIGVVVSASKSSKPAFDVGSWPAGVTIRVYVQGAITSTRGCALYSRYALTVDVSVGQGKIHGNTHTFPVYQANAKFGPSNTGGTSTAIPLPTGIVAGDLLLIWFDSDGNNTKPQHTMTIPGFTELFDDGNPGGIGRNAAFYKWADGTEGSFVILTASGGFTYGAYSVRIAGTDEATTPEFASAYAVGVTDPPSLSPSWGALFNLFMLLASCSTPSAGSSGYTQRVSGSGTVPIFFYDHNASVATENPGAFTNTAATYQVLTAAAKPAGPSIDGISFITLVGTGDLVGSQAN